MITNLRQLDLNLLLVFDALMQEQNLSRAALRLHMSQPTVSNALGRLRQQMGEPLFQRTARGMLPTAQAHLLYGPIRQAIELLRVGLGPQDAFDTSADVSFRLSMNDYTSASLLPPLLARLKSVAPLVRLSVQTDDADTLQKRLATAALDLAVDYLHFDDEDLRYQPLREEQLAVIARKSHPACKKGLTLAAYQACHHVSIQPRAGRGSPLEIVLGSAKVRRQIQLHVSHYLAIPAIVAQSDLLGTVPQRMAVELGHAFNIDAFPLPLEMPPVQMSLIWHRNQDAAPGLRWLRGQITDLASEMLP